MLISRSDLRKLRNKIHVRIFSSQTIQKHLLKYQNLTQEFIKRFESQLTWPEVCSLRSRVEVTMEAAAKASKNTICNHLDDEISQKSSQSMDMNSTFTFPMQQEFTKTPARQCCPMDTPLSMSNKVPLAEVGVSLWVSKDISHTVSFSEVSDQESEKALQMDSMSEAMAIILDSASSKENHDMIKSFIGETQDIMTASREISSKTILFTDKQVSSSETVEKPEEENSPVFEPSRVPVNVTPWKRRGIVFAKLF